MKMYGGVDIYTNVFLTSTVVGGERSASRPGSFTSGKEPPSIHRMRLVEPQSRSGRYRKVTILIPPGSQSWSSVRSQLLYRLRYPGSQIRLRECIKEAETRERAVQIRTRTNFHDLSSDHIKPL
jgi:hypothetical protein